jgi:probable HAF family extracellular repeat protein
MQRMLSVGVTATLLSCAFAAAGPKPGGGGGGGKTAAYTLVDLLGLPDGPGGGYQSDAVALSEPDPGGTVRVVGESHTGGEFHPPLWRVNADGSFDITDLGLPSGDIAARASDVNNAGVITINVITAAGDQPWVLAPGLPPSALPMPADRALAFAVSNSGEVVGWVQAVDGAFEGALWRLDAVGVPGGPIRLGSFIPQDINGPGLMAGHIADQEAALAWFDASGALQVRRLGVLPGYALSKAMGVSENGAYVVGTCYSAAGHEAFVWTQETGMIGLGALGGRSSYGYAVNSAGRVVGYAETGDPTYGHAAFLWRDGRMFDLNALAGLGQKSRIHLDAAKDINDAGHIVGGLSIGHPLDESHGFLLIPTAP